MGLIFVVDWALKIKYYDIYNVQPFFLFFLNYDTLFGQKTTTQPTDKRNNPANNQKSNKQTITDQNFS